MRGIRGWLKGNDIKSLIQSGQFARAAQILILTINCMFCKYCGTEIADDSIFCTRCGKKVLEDIPIVHKERVDDSNSIRVQLIDGEKDAWQATDNMQWVKPIGARIIQTALLVIGLFFLCYGIIWSCIIERRVIESDYLSSYPFFSRFVASADEPLGIIDVFVDLERDDPNFSMYKSEWEALYNEKYGLVDKERSERITKRLYKEWGIEFDETMSFLIDDRLTSEQRVQIAREIDRETPPVVSAPYDYVKYYYKAEKMAVSKFRIQVLFVFILPALILIVLSIIWIIRITPKSAKKTILPRDYADKIEIYSWIGFSLHKYIRYIKDDKYGIIDAVGRIVIVPATFELIEWRQNNKSYDGVLDGVRKIYYLD